VRSQGFGRLGGRLETRPGCVSSWRAAAVSGGIGNGLTPEQKQKKQEKDTYIRNALNPQHIPIQIQDAKMVCNPNTQYSKFSRFHPPDSHGSWIGRPIPQKCSPPGGYRMTQTTTAISSKREIGATLLYYGELLIHCFCPNLRCLRIGPPLLSSPTGA
jgi:hypothetical protein